MPRRCEGTALQMRSTGPITQRNPLITLATSGSIPNLGRILRLGTLAGHPSRRFPVSCRWGCRHCSLTVAPAGRLRVASVFPAGVGPPREPRFAVLWLQLRLPPLPVGVQALLADSGSHGPPPSRLTAVGTLDLEMPLHRTSPRGVQALLADSGPLRPPLTLPHRREGLGLSPLLRLLCRWGCRHCSQTVAPTGLLRAASPPWRPGTSGCPCTGLPKGVQALLADSGPHWPPPTLLTASVLLFEFRLHRTLGGGVGTAGCQWPPTDAFRRPWV